MHSNLPVIVIFDDPNIDLPDVENNLPEEYSGCEKLGIYANYMPNGRLGQAYTSAILFPFLVLEIACLWPHLMGDVPVRDVPAPEGRTGVRTHQ